MSAKLIHTVMIGACLFCLTGISQGIEKQFTINGEFGGDQFGDAVAVIDFNADGYDDFVVGAPASDANGLSSGKVYIYYGGPGADNLADIEIVGPSGSFFGASIANAGDINGDGYDDLLVGAPYYSGIASRAGAAYVFFGGPAPDTIPDLSLYGSASFDYYGTAVVGSMDFNGDGFADFAIGAFRADFGTFEDAGLVAVHYGSASPDTVADLILAASADGERFGMALASGDFNGDGYGDLAVGAYSFDDWGINLGRVYIFHGGLAPDSIFDFAVGGEVQGAYFGYSLKAGDLNGDNFDDLLVGAYGYKIGQAEAGKIYVYEGAAVMDTIADYSYILGNAAPDNLGFDVAVGADIDGDLIEDFWAGYPGGDGGILFRGGGYAVDTALYGESPGENFGHATAMSPNFFGVQQPGIIVGALAYDSYRGRVYVYKQDNAGGNQPPVLAPIGPKSVGVGINLNFVVTASDPDGTTPVLYTSTRPDGALFTDNGDGSGIFDWTPTAIQIGTHQITFYASDGEFIDSEKVAIEVFTDAVKCGDANADQQVNVGDPVFLINYIFKSGPAPNPLCRADVNGDFTVNVGDVVYLVSYIFREGNPPIEPCCP